MFRIIDLITSFLIPALIIYISVFEKGMVIAILGGGFSFIIICSFILLLSVLYKKFQPVLSAMAVISMTFAGLHYLAYLEVNKIIPFLYILILFSSLTFLIFICFLFLNISPIRLKKGSPFSLQEKEIIIRKSILERFISFPLFGVVYGIPTGLSFIAGAKSRLIRENIINYSNIAITLIILSFLATIIILKRVDKKYFWYVLKDSKKENVFNLKRRFWIGMIILFIFGSIYELFRGYWFFWLGTYVAIICIVIASWQLWRYILEPTEEYNFGEIAPEGLSSLFTNFRNLMLFFIFNFLFGTIFFVGFIVLLVLY